MSYPTVSMALASRSIVVLYQNSLPVNEFYCSQEVAESPFNGRPDNSGAN